MLTTSKYRFVIPTALVGSCIGFVFWSAITDWNATKFFEFGIWTGFGTMAPGLLVATGASDNTFEEGERYDSIRDASQKQERIQGTIPILATTLLAGLLIIIASFAMRFLVFPALGLVD